MNNVLRVYEKKHLSSKLTLFVAGTPGVLSPWGRKESDMTERLN